MKEIKIKYVCSDGIFNVEMSDENVFYQASFAVSKVMPKSVHGCCVTAFADNFACVLNELLSTDKK